MIRPRSIIWFERLFLASIAVRPIYLIVRWELLTFRSEQSGVPIGVLIALVALSFLIPLTLGWLAARRASRMAAWLVAIWILVIVLVYASSMVPVRWRWGILTDPAFAIFVLSVAAGIALFLPESRRWLARRPGLADLEKEFS